MPLGSAVRKVLGPLEPVAIRLYRDRFIDLDALAETVASVAPDSRRALEIGCGDGAMAAALRRHLPAGSILGIDPGVPTPGGLFAGNRQGASFERLTTTELIAQGGPPFDLVLLVDVLHHVADSGRQQLLQDAAALCAPGGTLAIKEWEEQPGVSGTVAFVADRYVSGDRHVRFMPRSELQALIDQAVGGWATTCVARIPPRRANLLLSYRRP